jgi:phosphatidylethanolamine/phosphatidyl-N-methylethanolamine N-methyltransferase
MRQSWADYRVFWQQFRQAYNSTGAVLPSGRGLARALTRFIRDGEVAGAEGTSAAGQNDRDVALAPRRILEVGPGTGAVTLQIIADMRPNDHLVLVERNQEFVDHLGQRLLETPEVESRRDRILLKHASVEELPSNETYDLIISGLPLNNFDVDLVERLLTKLTRLLAPGGILSFFEYVAVRRAKALVSSPDDRARLEGIARVLGDFLAGMEIRRDLVLANVPPAWVHHVRFGGIALEAPR